MGFATRISVGGMVLIAVMMATHANLAMAARWSTFTIPGCTTNDCTFEYYHSNGQTRKKNWKDAKSICQKKHRAELVSIASAEEQAFVATLGSGTTWLGLKRDDNSNDFEAFVDGTAVQFTSWAAGEPNNFKQREDCVLLHKKGRLWNDANCKKKARYVCKRPPVVYDTTTTTAEPDVPGQTTTTAEPETTTIPTVNYCAFKNPQGCCRAADGSDGDYSEVEADELLATGRGCKQMCSTNPSCTGFEVHRRTGRCEIHTGDISYVEQNVQLKCRCFKKDVTGSGYTNDNCAKPTTTTTTPCVFPGCTTSTTTSGTSTTTSVSSTTTSDTSTTTSVSSTTTSDTSTTTSGTSTTTTVSSTTTSDTVTTTTTSVSSTSTSTSTTSSTSTSTSTTSSTSTSTTSSTSTSTTSSTSTSTTSSTSTSTTSSTSTSTTSSTSTSTSTTTSCVADPTCSLQQCAGEGAEVTRQICPDRVFNVPGVVTFTYPLGTCSCLQGLRLSGPGCEAQGDCCPDTFTGECAP